MACARSSVFNAFLLACCGVLLPPAWTFTPSPVFDFENIGTEFNNIEIKKEIPQIALPFNISYLGYDYSKLFITKDGSVGFENHVDYIEGLSYFGGVRNPSSDIPFIAPLLYNGYLPNLIGLNEYRATISYSIQNYKDAANNSPDSTLRRDLAQYLTQSVINAPSKFDVKYVVVVKWENVAEGPESETHQCSYGSCNSTTFKLVLVGDHVNTFAIFSYDKLDFPVKKNYEAGFNAGKGRGWYSVLPCHGGCATLLGEDVLNKLPVFNGSDVQGRYIFSVGQEEVVRGGCLPNELLESGILEVFPRTIGMFGGEKLEVSGQCAPADSPIYCRFGSASAGGKVITGTMVNSFKGYCPVPPLTIAGQLDIYWSRDSQRWPADQKINIALPSRIGLPVNLDQSVREAWYSAETEQITIKWDPAEFSQNSSINVDIKILGYKESAHQVEYSELRQIGSTLNKWGTYTFNVDQHSCSQNCEEYEIGLLEVSLPAQYQRFAVKRVALRFGPVPLGWYARKDLEQRRGSDWASQKCKEWHKADSEDKQWIKELPSCPCNLDQALADLGRWQTDPGCNVFTRSQCFFHKGAKHCVRSVVPTSRDGAGNQCCYGTDGALLYSQLSYQGSTPDRSHIFGLYPYNQPNRVPELSHWKHDVISFQYCCLWTDYKLCDLYTELRPTVDCSNYNAPGLGLVNGLIHVRTFDGHSYNFNGAGDFILASNNESFTIQAKFEPDAHSWDLGSLSSTDTWRPRALTGVAFTSGRKKIEVTLPNSGIEFNRGLDVRVDGELQLFLHRTSLWQDFQDFSALNNVNSVSNNRHDNFTFYLTRFSIGVNVAAVQGALQVIVAAPPTYKSQGRPGLVGLLGSFDGNKENDLLIRNEDPLPLSSSKRSIYERFILSWKVKDNDYKIFRFKTVTEGIEFIRFFDFGQIHYNFSGAPSPNVVSTFCRSSEACKWDYQITGDQKIAQSTRDADNFVRTLQAHSSRVDSCGLPDVGTNVVLSSLDFSVDKEVKVTKCRDDSVIEKEVTFKCVNETFEEATKNNHVDRGVVRVYNNQRKYVLVWEPQPYDVCPISDQDGADSSNLPLIIGITLGASVAVIVAIVVVVILRKRKSKDSKVRRPAETGKRKSEIGDPAEAEAVLSKIDKRSPVYTPSKEAVRLTDAQGSNV